MSKLRDDESIRITITSRNDCLTAGDFLNGVDTLISMFKDIPREVLGDILIMRGRQANGDRNAR